MVPAELVKFKHGLYKSCGIECLEGIMLEPCLLQPCLHVAGLFATANLRTNITDFRGFDSSISIISNITDFRRFDMSPRAVREACFSSSSLPEAMACSGSVCRLSIYVSLSLYMYIYIYIYLYVYIYIYTHLCVYSFFFVFIFCYLYVSFCQTQYFTCSSSIWTSAATARSSRVKVHMMYIYIYIYIYTYIYVYTHFIVQTSFPALLKLCCRAPPRGDSPPSRSAASPGRPRGYYVYIYIYIYIYVACKDDCGSSLQRRDQSHTGFYKRFNGLRVNNSQTNQ